MSTIPGSLGAVSFRPFLLVPVGPPCPGKSPAVYPHDLHVLHVPPRVDNSQLTRLGVGERSTRPRYHLVLLVLPVLPGLVLTSTSWSFQPFLDSVPDRMSPLSTPPTPPTPQFRSAPLHSSAEKGSRRVSERVYCKRVRGIDDVTISILRIYATRRYITTPGGSGGSDGSEV